MRERERERCKIRTRVFLGGSLEINIKKQEKNIFINNKYYDSRTMTCTPVQFILRLPMMFVFHQLLRVPPSILPSLVFSIMGIYQHH